MRGIFLGLSMFAVIVPAAAVAAETGGACAAPVAPTGELAPWSAPAPLGAADGAAHLAHASIAVGKAVDLALHPADKVGFPSAPGRPGGNGGLAQLTVKTAGTYRVALATAAWIDLVKDGKALESIAHGHGAACSGIRKIVDFALVPGTYVLAISGNADARTRVLVAKKP